VQRIAALAGETRWQGVLSAAMTPSPSPRSRSSAKVEAASAQRQRRNRARPLRLSVTAIEDWLRDPIRSMPVTFSADALVRSTRRPARATATVIHGAIGDYTAKFAAGLPADAVTELRKLAKNASSR